MLRECLLAYLTNESLVWSAVEWSFIGLYYDFIGSKNEILLILMP